MIYIVVEFPDLEAARAARISGVSLHSTRVTPDEENDDGVRVVFRGEVDGETLEVAAGCDCDHGLHRIIELAGPGCYHPGCPCVGFFTDE
jgi:hypothetical protein